MPRTALAWRADLPASEVTRTTAPYCGDGRRRGRGPGRPCARRERGCRTGGGQRRLGGVPGGLLAVTQPDYGLLGPRYLSIVGTVSSLSVVIPATDDPSTLPACRAALAASTDPADEIIVVDRPASLSASDARNAGRARRDRGRARVRRCRRRGAPGRPRPDPRRVRAGPAAHRACTARTTTRRAPDGTVSVFRNLLHHHVHQTGGGSGGDVLERARGRAPNRLPGGRRLRRHPVPPPVDRGHRAGPPAHGGRRPAPARSDDPGHPPQAVDAPLDAVDRLRPPRGARGWRSSSARAGSPPRSTAAGDTGSARWCARWPRSRCSPEPFGRALALGGALVALNHAFYALLIRQLGVARGLAGVGLHGLHHLASVVALPAGVAMACAAGLRQPRRAGDDLEPTLAAGVEP